MTDPRVLVVTTSKGFFALDKRYDTYEELERGVAETIARRERIAGRTLDKRELLRGPDRIDDRDARQRMADFNWRPTTKIEADTDDNPFRDYQRPQTEPLHGKQFRKALMEQAERDWDQRTAEAQAEPMSARRMAAVERAQAYLERTRFDPLQPLSAVVRAEQLLQEAQSGSLDVFRSQYNEAQAALRQQADQRREAVNQEIERLQADRDGLADFESEQPTPATSAGGYHFNSPEDRARREDGYRLAWGHDQSKWPAEARE